MDDCELEQVDQMSFFFFFFSFKEKLTLAY